MKNRILLCVCALFFLGTLTLADSLAPTPHQAVVINLPYTYPDNSFYVCSYDITSKINNSDIKPDKTTRIYNKYILQDFSLIKLVKLSPETPYIQKDVLDKSGDSFLIAVKKDIEDKGSSTFEESVIKLSLTPKDQNRHFMVSGDGIYMIEIYKSMEGPRSPEIVVNEVTDLSQDGLKLRVYDGRNLDLTNVQDIDQISKIKQPQVCAGILMSLGFIFGTIWFFRKDRHFHLVRRHWKADQ